MPALVYVLLAVWLAFAVWLTWRSKISLDKQPDVYLGNDNVWRMLRGKLPPAQQKLQVRHLVWTFTSLVLLAILITLVMTWHSMQNG